VIKERECVGSYLGHSIFKVSSLQVLACNHTLKSSSAEQVRKFVIMHFILLQVYNFCWTCSIAFNFNRKSWKVNFLFS